MNDITQLKTVTVRVTRRDNGEPAVGSVVLVIIRVPKKNSYSVGPSVIGKTGRIEFTREELEEEIERYMKTSPMDYACYLNDALAFEAKVLDAAAIRGLIKARQMWGAAVEQWRISETELRHLNAAVKASWKAATSVIQVGDQQPLEDRLQIEISTEAECT